MAIPAGRIVAAVRRKLPHFTGKCITNRSRLWLSNWAYDPTAKLIWIDDTYPAFIRYTDTMVLEGWVGGANGNVITLHPEYHPGGDGDKAAGAMVLQHEMQHVIDWYHIRDYDTEIQAHPLRFEKRCHARELLSVPERPSFVCIEQAVFALGQHGMAAREAYAWIEDVLRSRSYEDVRSPYRVGAI